MLGAGCPFKNSCARYKRETDFWKNSYCNSVSGCEKCAERPKNTGNRELQRQNDKFKKDEASSSWFLIGVIVVVGYLVVKNFM